MKTMIIKENTPSLSHSKTPSNTCLMVMDVSNVSHKLFNAVTPQIMNVYTPIVFNIMKDKLLNGIVRTFNKQKIGLILLRSFKSSR
jgi:hypothetical protein